MWASIGSVLRFRSPLREDVICMSFGRVTVSDVPSSTLVIGITRVKVMTECAAVGNYSGFFGRGVGVCEGGIIS
jgi:hypothetical protein